MITKIISETTLAIKTNSGKEELVNVAEVRPYFQAETAVKTQL